VVEMTRFEWTEARITKLVTMWGERETCSAIAAAVGCATAGVRGKVQKLRRDGYDVPQRQASPVNRAKPKQRKHHDVLRAFPEMKPMPANVGPSRRVCQHIAGTVPKWPEEPVFCGEPSQEGSSYCPTHHSLCYIAFIPRHLRTANDKKKAVQPSYRMAGER
jgi:hypothetical protein